MSSELICYMNDYSHLLADPPVKYEHLHLTKIVRRVLLLYNLFNSTSMPRFLEASEMVIYASQSIFCVKLLWSERSHLSFDCIGVGILYEHTLETFDNQRSSTCGQSDRILEVRWYLDSMMMT